MTYDGQTSGLVVEPGSLIRPEAEVEHPIPAKRLAVLHRQVRAFLPVLILGTFGHQIRPRNVDGDESCCMPDRHGQRLKGREETTNSSLGRLRPESRSGGCGNARLFCLSRLESKCRLGALAQPILRRCRWIRIAGRA